MNCRTNRYTSQQMRKILLIFISFLSLTGISAQKVSENADTLTTMQAHRLFTASIRQTLDLPMPIYRVYKYSNKSELYYCVLTENKDKVADDGSIYSTKIKAVAVKKEGNSFKKQWQIYDSIIKKDNIETSIWFWTKYSDFKDNDADGSIDPVIVYGTSGMNGYDDGRIKIITFYKGQRSEIGHQNGTLDFERETKVDKLFYSLPVAIQEAVKERMTLMTKNNHAIFPHGWQNAMINKKTFISERKER